MYCANCGNEVKDGVKFCTGCGTPVEAGQPPAQQTAPPAPAPQGGTVPPYQHAPTAQQPTQIPQQPVQYQSYTAPEKTPFYKKKAFLIAAGVLLFMVIIGSLMEDNNPPSGGEQAGGENKPVAQSELKTASAEKKSKGPAVRVSSVDLFRAYNENEVAADKKYRDKMIEVSGTIQEIGKDLLTDEPNVRLSSGENDMGITSVSCTFRSEHSDELAELKKGQQITLRGKGAGFNIGIEVMVHYCEVVK